jgi:hypothetical protein
MISTLWRRIRALWCTDFLSAKDLVRRAVVISIVYLIAQFIGLREFTTVLTGTTGSVRLGWGMSAFLGLLYLCIYLAFVLLVPMLLIAATLLALYRNCTQRQVQSPASQPVNVGSKS